MLRKIALEILKLFVATEVFLWSSALIMWVLKQEGNGWKDLFFHITILSICICCFVGAIEAICYQLANIQD